MAAKETITAMLDQIFGRFFSSQWIVFAVLLVLLVGLSELAWRMGLASSRKKSRRAQLLPEPHAASVVQLLREYVPLRIEAHREGQFSDQFATTRKQSADLQDRMWVEAVAAAAERPSPITASFIASLNETIDLEAKRIAAKRNHVPGAVWLLLLCVAGCG